MKTKALTTTTTTDTRKSRKLFGLSEEQLKLVTGGTGVIVNGQHK
jgi:hypothetical protein